MQSKQFKIEEIGNSFLANLLMGKVTFLAKKLTNVTGTDPVLLLEGEPQEINRRF